MNKEEFIQELRTSLQGNVSVAQVNENVRYYDNYIIEEVRKGKTQEQVIQELGSPRLLAKTIIDTSGWNDNAQSQGFYEEQPGNNYEEEFRQEEQNKTRKGFHVDYSEENGWDVRIGRFKLNSWYGTLLIVAIIVLIIGIIGSLFIAVLPVLIPIVLILMLISIIGSRR